MLGICGAPDDGDDYEESVRHLLRRHQGRQVYGHLENQRSSTTNIMIAKNEMDVELT